MHVTEKECQTDDVVFLERDEYEDLGKRHLFALISKMISEESDIS
jgi:hypothetical protein